MKNIEGGLTDEERARLVLLRGKVDRLEEKFIKGGCRADAGQELWRARRILKGFVEALRKKGRRL